MSLGIVVKGSEGIVLAADSRVTLTARQKKAPNLVVELPVNFDNATKLLTFAEPNTRIGAVTFGDAVIGTKPSEIRTAKSLIPEFEVELKEEGNSPLGVEELASKLSDFFGKRWEKIMPADHSGSGMEFVVAGFDSLSAYGSVFQFNIPNKPEPVEQAKNDFGITMGGQHEISARMLQGFDIRMISTIEKVLSLDDAQAEKLRKAIAGFQLQIPFAVLPLQDCIDLAVFLIKTTTTAQNLSIGIRGVGGAVDVAVITRREGLRVIQEKDLVAERP